MVGKKADVKLVKLKCKACKYVFGIDEQYMGVITCPYCAEYVEG